MEIIHLQYRSFLPCVYCHMEILFSVHISIFFLHPGLDFSAPLSLWSPNPLQTHLGVESLTVRAHGVDRPLTPLSTPRVVMTAHTWSEKEVKERWRVIADDWEGAVGL